MEPLAGKLLVATPQLADPNFFRTVLLVCEHNEDGAIGIILNRPTAEIVEDHLPQWAPMCSHPAVVFEGGPVQREVAIGIAGNDSPVVAPGWNPITDRVGMFDLGFELAETTAPDRLRVFAGYAGWTGGKLEAEIVTGSWFVVPSTEEDAFGAAMETLWHDVLVRQPGMVAMFANFPYDPGLN